MKENLVREKGWALLRALFLAAKKDGEIDFDEQRILKATDDNVMQLLETVRRAWDDSVLTETEKQQITFMIKKIKDDAVSLAEYDSVISEQEDEMLNIIYEKIYEFLELH
ncbi:MAG: hypothetical protein ACXAE3_08710 [Candidatus Kariarchaeaceae archaeon]|jgi:hypothetical protein